jgi:outer membrane receptor for Fe3+-dicitrate
VGGVYEGFRAPNIDDLTSTKTYLQNAQAAPTLATLDVQPEHAYTYEVGFKYDSPRFRLQVFEYWIDFQDSIGRVTDGAGNALLANTDAYLNGTEAFGEYLLTDEWSLYGNFMYNYGFDVDLNEPYSRTAPTQGILGLRWRDCCRRSFIDVYTWMVRRQDRYAVLNLTDSRFPVGGTPGYATLNLRAGHTFGNFDQHHVSLGLENITDKAYRVLGSGVDGAGFNAILGYTYTH